MRICLITTSQPSANPRLVKEADALSAAGYDVHVIAAHRVDWATDADPRLLAGRRWSCTFIDWRRHVAPALFWKIRARHFVARKLQAVPGLSRLSLPAAADRPTPELTRAAIRIPADLYVAHNPGALPAAAAAARVHGALLGFDAEDYHSGEFADDDRSTRRKTTGDLERRFLPRCDYITAASPGIADAYAPLSRCGRPTPILNVFPLASRPLHRREGRATGPLSLYWFSQTIGPYRGLENVVRAIGRFPDGAIELHLRGQWQPDYEARLRRVAVDAGLAGHRMTSHPPADADEMVRLAAAFDVGLAIEPAVTVNNDLALSNKIFTYLLAGTAVIATRTRGQAGVIDALGEAARAYAPGDVEGAAAALRAWVDDRRALEQARAAAWTQGETRYNWDAEQRAYLRVIANVWERRPAHAVRTAAAAAS